MSIYGAVHILNLLAACSSKLAAQKKDRLSTAFRSLLQIGYGEYVEFSCS
ncbi:hypothetical protein QWZ13_17510 [Reinekea marina]|nr:hypothetical protein [Reinekea marina]MDN3650707.1 hypothetical protein [Reinekea marina]